MSWQPLSRRTLLRGVGASLALPWLEAMASTPSPAKRMAILYMPNGVHQDTWTPEGTGRDFTLAPSMAPLSDFKNDLVILSNLWNQASVGGDGHYVKMSGFLTCTTITKTLGVDINANGTSMDQVAAQRMTDQTPLPSLELCTAPVTTGVDKNVGYTRVYGSHIAWAGPTKPLAREIDPRMVYERLLRATRPAGDAAKDDVNLLDSVLDDAKKLRTKLGQADRRRMDEYLSVVRSLEERLQRSARPGQSSWKPRVPVENTPKPPEEPKDFADRVRLMMDMIALAFQTDTTRIATFIFGNEVTNQNFSFLDGVKGGHHDMSHHQKDPEKLKAYQIITQWHVAQYAYLLRKLRDMQEGESNVLNQSMILLGAGIRDGDKHDPHNLPLILAGKAGGRIATGQHLVYTKDSPLSNLYLSMLDAFGAPVERFGDSNGKLTGVLA